MKRLTFAVRRHPSAAVVLLVLSISGAAVLGTGGAQASSPRAVGGKAATADPALVERGRQLYLPGCSSCHGVGGGGARTDDGDVRGPSLKNSGEAAAYYYLHTGRMPLANSEDVPMRKEPAYSEPDMDALVAFVGSLGDGPKVPDVDIAAGNLTRGGEIFRGNCAACHSASGAGGALSYGRAAPSLGQAEPREIGSAVRVGPGQMPEFGRDIINDRELDAVARYVTYLRDPEDPGGLALGRVGPIPEGFLIWIFGMGVLLVSVAWIGKRSRPTLAGEVPNEEDG